MKKNRLLWLISLISVLIVSAVCAVVVVADNNSYVWDEVTLKSDYFVGETFEVPEINVALGEDEYEADFVFEYPNGDRFVDTDANRSTPCEFALTLPGEYKISYLAEVGDETVSHTVTFTVKQKLFSVSSTDSRITYGKERFTYKYAATDENSVAYSTGLTGLGVKLASGDTFNYNKVIDVSKCTAFDELIRFHMLPAVNGERECEDIAVVLTDAYDPSNYIEFRAQSNAGSPMSQLLWDNTDIFAGATGIGQPITSYTPGAGVQVQINTGVGANAVFTFYGNSPYTSVGGKSYLAFTFDYAQKQPFFKAGNTGGTKICDLDDPFFFTKLWGGFTTGECFLSLHAVGNIKDRVNLFISGIIGEELSDGLLTKDTEPTMTIDMDGMAEDEVFTVIGREFDIFKASAVDPYDGVLPVISKAYYGYYSSSKTELDVVDGKFVADKLGVVTIEYTVFSLSGEAFIKTIDVPVFAEDVLSVVLDPDKTVTGKAGDRVKISDYQIVGALGNIDVETTVTLNGANVPLNSDGVFVAVSEGTYTVSYKGVDALGQVLNDTYTVTVAQNNDPVFIGDVIVPKYFIVGHKHVLPEFPAFDYADNTEKVVSSTVKVNGVAGKEFTPTAAGDVTVQYVATTATGTTTKTYSAKAINVSRDTNAAQIDFAKYFVGDANVEPITSVAYGVNVVAKEGVQSAKVAFVKSVGAYDFTYEFVVDKARRNFTNVEVYIKDVLDANNFIKISANVKTMKVTVNDLETPLQFADNMFNTDGKASAQIVFDARTGEIKIGTNSYIVKGYTPFSGGLVEIETAMTEIVGESAIQIRKISNQTLRKQIIKDIMVPLLAFDGKYSIYEDYNNEITIYKATAYDVLSFITESYLSVTTPSGEYVVAKDGTVLNKVSIDKDYQIILDEYGKFAVSYYTKDSSGNELPETKYLIGVVDRTPPEITFTSGLPKTGKVGDIIPLPSYTTKDNLAGDIKVSVIVTNSYDGTFVLMTEKDKTFTIREAAIYKLTYIVSDVAGNVTMVSVSVDCTEVE